MPINQVCNINTQYTILSLCLVICSFAAHLAPPKLLGYKLVGDNIDKGVKARFMRVEQHCGQSLHYFHFCAIQNMIDFGDYPDVLPHTCLDSPTKRALYLLPSDEDTIRYELHLL